MILQALYNITRENPSALISDMTLTILQQLVTIHQNKKSKKRGSSIEVDDRTVAETQAVGFRSPHSDNILGRLRASFYGRPPSFLSLAMGCLVSVVKALGCPLGKLMFFFFLCYCVKLLNRGVEKFNRLGSLRNGKWRSCIFPLSRRFSLPSHRVSTSISTFAAHLECRHAEDYSNFHNLRLKGP